MSVVLLFGGTSSERLVSVASAQHVARVLPGARLWFMQRSGAIHLLEASELGALERPFEHELVPTLGASFANLEDALAGEDRDDLVLLLALHGGDGENGTLQRKLEQWGVAFTGSGSAASAAAFDKARAKQIVGAQGARLAASRVLPPLPADAAEAELRALLELSPRWVLKPVADGSSMGLLSLAQASHVRDVAAALSARHVSYLAEQFVAGRELTVGVIDEPAGPRALAVSEVVLAPDATFDYAGKYLGRGNEEITPARLTAEETHAAQALALLAHGALGCEGYSRTDMILTHAGPVFLETNTLPGLTMSSFIPQQLRALDKDFADFLREQVALARTRRARTQR